MRKVKVLKWEKENNESRYQKVPDFEGMFHEFGISYEEFENGPGNFTTGGLLFLVFIVFPVGFTAGKQKAGYKQEGISNFFHHVPYT